MLPNNRGWNNIVLSSLVDGLYLYIIVKNAWSFNVSKTQNSFTLHQQNQFHNTVLYPYLETLPKITKRHLCNTK